MKESTSGRRNRPQGGKRDRNHGGKDKRVELSVVRSERLQQLDDIVNFGDHRT